jgi:toxin ParE1/3/4
MALTLKWTEDAAEDIVSIAEFISRDSEFYAKAVVKKIIDKIKIIPESPEIGRVVPEIEDPKIRERLVYSYRIVYQITDDILWIVAIFHGKQLIESKLSVRIDS